MCNKVKMHLDSILRIQDLGFYRISYPYTHPDRKLDWNVFLYVSEGQMEVWEEGTEYLVRKGQFLFLKSGLHHWGEPKTPAGTSWYWIHFFNNASEEDRPEWKPNWNSAQALPISPDEYQSCLSLPKQGSIPSSAKLEKQLDSMIGLYQSTDPFRAATLSLQTMELLLDLYRDSQKKNPLTKSDRTIQRIIGYLEQKDGYNLDSQELASDLRMNYSYLCEIFRQKTGSTIHLYNSQLFIDKAVGMMRNSDLNISEISEKLGFNNPFYFSRVFRKIIGCAPSEYMSRIYRGSR